MSAVRIQPPGRIDRVVRVPEAVRAAAGDAGLAVAVDDPVLRDVDHADREVVLLGGDDPRAVGVKNASSGTVKVCPGRRSPGRGNSQPIRPAGRRSAAGCSAWSAISTGPGSTDGSEPGARCGPGERVEERCSRPGRPSAPAPVSARPAAPGRVSSAVAPNAAQPTPCEQGGGDEDEQRDPAPPPRDPGARAHPVVPRPRPRTVPIRDGPPVPHPSDDGTPRRLEGCGRTVHRASACLGLV